jgi:hypothetical protein
MLEQIISNAVISGLLIWILIEQKKRVDKHEATISNILEITVKSQNSIVSILGHLQQHDEEISLMLKQISDNQSSIAILLERTKKL